MGKLSRRHPFTLRTAVTFCLIEFRRIRNHVIRTSIAGSPLLTYHIRWAIYRMSGLKIYSPKVREQCVVDNSFLEIGRRSFVNRACFFEGNGRIIIGEDAMIGPHCSFLTSHHDALMVDGELSVSDPVARDVLVGKRVWVGANVTFLPGSSTDDDVVVAAGAVVRGHLQRGWIYGGVPATRIALLKGSPSQTNNLTQLAD